MKYVDYQERMQQGTFNFPIAFYHQTPRAMTCNITGIPNMKLFASSQARSC